jgi:hypothetical protein
MTTGSFCLKRYFAMIPTGRSLRHAQNTADVERRSWPAAGSILFNPFFYWAAFRAALFAATWPQRRSLTENTSPPLKNKFKNWAIFFKLQISCSYSIEKIQSTLA